jgi:hypothetical protein
MNLRNAGRPFVDIVKLRDYSLNPEHKEVKHKARVFASALGLRIDDAEWLRRDCWMLRKMRSAGKGGRPSTANDI